MRENHMVEHTYLHQCARLAAYTRDLIVLRTRTQASAGMIMAKHKSLGILKQRIFDDSLYIKHC